MTDAAPRAAQRPRRRGLLLPLILIAVGGAFLAANLGYLPPISVRALFQLWPLLLILPGIEMLVGRREPYVALAIEILVIAGAVALVAAQPARLVPSLLGGAPATTSATVTRDGARTLSLRIDGGGGTYTLAGGAASLVEARSAGGEIEVSTSRGADSADVRVKPTDQGGGLFTTGGVPPVNVDVRVASDVPTTVRVSVGAGDFTIDLRDIQVRDARIETGASRIAVTLPRPSGDVPVRVQAGAASVAVIIPDGVEARITTMGALLSTASENARLGAATGSSLARSGSSTETAGYAAAKDRVTVTVEAGASSVTIR